MRRRTLPLSRNHIGGLMRVGPYGNRDGEVLPAWREGIATLAKCPNVVMKLGGVGQPRYGFDWHTREQPIGSEELAGGTVPSYDLLHRTVRPGEVHVREQLPS